MLAAARLTASFTGFVPIPTITAADRERASDTIASASRCPDPPPNASTRCSQPRSAKDSAHRIAYRVIDAWSATTSTGGANPAAATSAAR